MSCNFIYRQSFITLSSLFYLYYSLSFYIYMRDEFIKHTTWRCFTINFLVNHDSVHKINNEALMWFLVFICLLSTFTTICSSSLFNNNHYDNQIQLQPPHLTGNYDAVRPSIELRSTKTRVKSKSRASMRKDSSFPCNGSAVRTNGTTCGLKEIMIGRCLEYQYAKPVHVLSNQT